MAWIEVFFEAPVAAQSLYEEWLLAHGALAVSYTYTDDKEATLWEPDPDSSPTGQAEMIGLFEDNAEARAQIDAMRAAHPERHLQTRPLAESDWLRACQRDFPAKRFGKHLWVCPSWEEPPALDAKILRLDPGLAFGTGAHPTTQLCLEALDSVVQPDSDFLDYGCGSGILAMAACVLGAREAWAIDHCPQALESTRDNAQQNGLAARIHTGLPAALPQDFQADIVCANILAGPLCALAPTLWQHTRPGGLLILSGFLAEQVPQLRESYAAHTQNLELRWEGEWGCALLTKNNLSN